MTEFNQKIPLSSAMRLFAYFLIVAGVSSTLVGQPLEYWLEFNRATTDLPWVRAALTVHPLLFTAITIVYLVCLELLFKRLARRPSLVLWIAICFVHVRYTVFGLSSDLERFVFIQSDIRHPIEFTLFVLFSAVLGAFLARMLQTEQPEISAAEHKPVKIGRGVFLTAVSLLAIWLLTLNLWLMRTSSFSDFGWRPVLSENRPEPISSIEVAYDTNRQTAVLFGGEYLSEDSGAWTFANKTWEWDGVNWVQRFPVHQPPGRAKHAMAYDPLRGVVVLFGGVNESGDLADVWEWDGEDWIEKRPSSSSPPPRCCHSAFFDPQQGKVMVYGGVSGDYFFTDGWAWDGSEWESIYFEGTSPHSSGQDIEYYEAAGYSVLVPNFFWQGANWTIKQLEPMPEHGQLARLVYDPDNKQIIMFGGTDGEALYNDTWLLTQDGWQQLDLPQLPPGRWGHAMFYDQVRRRVVLFGGTAQSSLNDMWELRLPGEE